MVGKTNVGGGAKLFAAIGVTYPAGSTLTCTNGTSTLKAKTTTGQWVFAIPKTGTWTVTVTDGTNTKSQSVSITSEGQFESVELSYAWELFNEVDGFATGYSGSGTDSNSKATVSTDSVGKYIRFPQGGGNNRMSYIAPAVDLTEYNTLEIYGYTTNKITSLTRYFGVWTAKPTSTATPAAKVDMIDSPAPSSYLIDVSELSGNYYLGTQYAQCDTIVYRLIFS